MIIKVTNEQGETAFVDNYGQENGAVRIQGDSSLVSHLDRVLNGSLTVQFRGHAEVIDDEFLLQEEGRPTEIYKASDHYLRNYFIPVECPLFGYSTEIVKE